MVNTLTSPPSSLVDQAADDKPQDSKLLIPQSNQAGPSFKQKYTPSS